MSYDPEPIVARYLKRLDHELRGLPRERRREVVNEIAEHIAQTLEASPVASEAELLNLLERIGDPSEIASDARERFDVPTGSSWHELAAIILLLIGGFLFVVGWFVGVMLLWTSKIWTLRDKLIGTLLFPGGLAFSTGVLVIGVGSGTTCNEPLGPGGRPLDPATTCSGDSGGTSVLQVILIGAFLLVPVLTSMYLAWRLRTLEPADGGSRGAARRTLGTAGWIALAVVVVLVAFIWLASQTLIPADHNGS